MGNNNNILNLLISANLDPNSKKNIQEDLKSLKLEPIEIKVNSEAVDILKRFSEEMKKISNAVGITNDKLSKQVMIMKNVETGELEKRTRIFTDDGIVDKWSKITEKQKESFEQMSKQTDTLKKQESLSEEVLSGEKQLLEVEKQKTEEYKKQLDFSGSFFKEATRYNKEGSAILRRHYYDQGSRQMVVSRTGAGEVTGYQVVEKKALTVGEQQNNNYREAQRLLNNIKNLEIEIINSKNVSVNIDEERNHKLTAYKIELENLKAKTIKSGNMNFPALGNSNLTELENIKKQADESVMKAHRKNQEQMTSLEIRENEKRINSAEKFKKEMIKKLEEIERKNQQYMTKTQKDLLSTEKQNLEFMRPETNTGINNEYIERYRTQLEGLERQINETAEAQKRLMSMGTNVSHTINSETHGYLFSEENKAHMQNYLESVYGVNTKIQGLQYGFDKTGKSVITFDRIIKNNNNTITKSKETVDIATGSIRNFGGRTEEVLNRNIGLWKAFTIAMARIPVWFAGMTVYVQAIRFLGNSVKYIVDIDNAMNQIRIVTGISADEAERLGKAYNKLAKEMSVTTTEIATASVEFARQGLSQDEINERLIETIKYAKISNLEFVEASEIMTATVNSMKIDIDRASDVFSYMGECVAPSYSNI